MMPASVSMDLWQGCVQDVPQRYACIDIHVYIYMRTSRYTCIRPCAVCRGLDAEAPLPGSGQPGAVLSRACCAEAVPLLTRPLLERAWAVAPAVLCGATYCC